MLETILIRDKRNFTKNFCSGNDYERAIPFSTKG